MLEFVKKIETKKNSIFYSLFRKNDGKIIGVGRELYSARRSIHVEFDEKFDIIKENDAVFHGEDPRIFECNGDIYMTDNYSSDIHVYNFTTNKSIKINLLGKNFPIFEYNGKIFTIHIINPFTVYLVDFESGDATLYKEFPLNSDFTRTYRGGTPGYKNPWVRNAFYGFGHKTHIDNNTLKHDLFLWKLSFGDDTSENEIVSYEIIDIAKPPGGKNVFDPTSIICMHDEYFLITAESDREWFHEQDYDTNVYKINPELFRNFLQYS